MRNARSVILTALVGFAVAGAACTQKVANDTTNATDVAFDKTKAATDTTLDRAKESADKALDRAKEGTATAIVETQKAGDKTADTNRNVLERTADKTKEIAGDIAAKTKEVSSATGEAITDAWITTKVSAKFVDEKLLKDSNIDVDTDNHVVTLKGHVASAAAKTRAATIARGTEGVKRVVNQLVVT